MRTHRLDADEVDEVAEAFRVDTDILWLRGSQKATRRDYWTVSLPINQAHYTSLSEVADRAFKGGIGLKYYLLRRLLLDESYGVLRSQEDRTELINQFLVNWLDQPDDDAASFVRECLQTLTDQTEPELLYRHLYPLLMDIILLPPEDRVQPHILANEQAGKIFNDLFMRGQFGSMDRDSAEATMLFDALQAKIHGLITGEAQLIKSREEAIITDVINKYSKGQGHAISLEDLDKILKRQNAEISFALDRERNRLRTLRATRQQALSTTQRLDEAFRAEREHHPTNSRLSALDLLFILGEKSGALGTRMLQLGGMYFDMPDTDREKFAHVYDDMRGQTRLQAWNTLKREARLSPSLQEVLSNLVEFRPRLGGGSLMTVYEARYSDGSREALAVKNPNAEYHVSRLVDMVDSMLAGVASKRPDESRIALVRSLLTDVTEWINDELKDPDFEAKDAAFKFANDHRHGQFESGHNHYKLLVPDSKPTGTRWIRRDELVEGVNLNALKPTNGPTDLSQGHINQAELQQAISLLVRNYVYQLTETGLVHSDIHPGNFRITSDNSALAIFDRYNLLEFDSDERNMLRTFIKSMASGRVDTIVQSLVDHILLQPRNLAVADSAREPVKALLEAEQQSNLVDIGPKLLLLLKQNGVSVPIKFTLVMKNILSLQRMSKSAGFDSVVEAFLSTASPQEIAKLVS